MKGVDPCYEGHRYYVHLRWRQQECRSQPPWSPLPSRQRQPPLQQRAVSRPTGDRTGRGDQTRATGITRNGARAGTTATQHPVGYRRSAGRHLRTGPRLQAGTRRQAGHRHPPGSGLVPDHFSTLAPAALCIASALSLPRWGQAQGRLQNCDDRAAVWQFVANDGLLCHRARALCRQQGLRPLAAAGRHCSH